MMPGIKARFEPPGMDTRTTKPHETRPVKAIMPSIFLRQSAINIGSFSLRGYLVGVDEGIVEVEWRVIGVAIMEERVEIEVVQDI
jgi:hypothetical protein